MHQDSCLLETGSVHYRLCLLPAQCCCSDAVLRIMFQGIISWQQISQHFVDREINQYFWIRTEVMLQKVRDYCNEGKNTCEFLSY